jgi:hypothetical protein
MPTRMKPAQKSGLLVDVNRVLSVGRERSAREAVLWFRNE